MTETLKDPANLALDHPENQFENRFTGLLDQRLARVLLAQLPPIIAGSFQWMFWDQLKPLTWFLFYPAVFISSFIGGLAGAIPATLIAISMAVFFFVPPYGAFPKSNSTYLFSVAAFLVTGILFGFFNRLLERTNRKTLALLESARYANAELKRSEAALKLEQERLDLAVSAAGLGLYDWNPQSGSVIFGDRWGALFGYSLNELPGLYSTWSERVHPEDLPTTRKATADAFRNGTPYTCEYRMRHKDKSWHWILDQGRIVDRDEQGEVVRFVGAIIDITERKHAEESILAASQKLTLHTQQTTVAIIEWDSKFCVTGWNTAAERVFGFSAAEAMGQHANFIIPEAFHELVEPVLKGLLAGDGGDRSTNANLRKDGRIIQCEWFNTTLRDVNGRLLGVASLVDDITERRQAEEALKRSEEELKRQNGLFSSLLEIIPMGVFMVEVPSGKPLLANDAACTLLGQGILPDASRHNLSEVYKAYKAGSCNPYPLDEMPILRGMNGEASHIDDMLVERPDGTQTLLEVFGSPVTDDQNKIWASLVSFYDITDRKKAVDALQQSEQKFRALFENLAEGVALHDLVTDQNGKVIDYRILDVNPAFQSHTGLERTTAPGRLGTEIYGTEVPPYLEVFSQVALGGEPYVFETYFPPLEKHFRISVIAPKHGQFATVFEDITEQKRREEELKQKNTEMERFTYMISHDLKSPLVTVRTFLGYLEQDLEQGKAERVAKDMGFIRDATGKMGRLLEDLLEVSRVGRVMNPPVKLTFSEVVKEALQAVAGAISTRGVTVQVEGTPVTLFGDRPRLEEVWQNLIENAVKYMGDQPTPRVIVGAETTGPETVFYVRDNGMGIDPRFQGKIFDLFEKLDAASEGTGLGLALVKRIVEVYEGRVWVESEGLGQGTCFRFTLPQALKNRKEGDRS